MVRNDNDSLDYMDSTDSADSGDFSLEAILEEYKSFPYPGTEEEDENGEDSIRERSREIVIEALDHTIGTARISSVDELLAESDEELKSELKARESEEDFEQEGTVLPELGDEAPELDLDAAMDPGPEFEESFSELTDSAVESGDYSSADFPEPPPEPAQPRRTTPSRGSILTPIVSLLALVAVRRQQRKADGAGASSSAPAEDIPEPKPAKAYKFYERQIKPLNMRSTIAAILCLLLVYISYGLPVFGAMRGNVATTALMCMLIELVVVLVGLDVFTNGVLSLLRGRPGAESLVAVSCLLSVLDAVVIALTGNEGLGLPFCAVSALSMLFAILGARLTCIGYRCSFRALALGKAPYVITAERGLDNEGSALLKSQISHKGFINRSEGSDFSEDSCRLFAPFLMIAALVLTILATFVRGRPGDFVHTLSALTAVSASFSVFLAFALPFSVTAKNLMKSGAAIAGYAGLSDIGKSRRIVITDNDIFPPGTISIDGIRILEGAYTDKVISYTGSVLAASGAGPAPAFTELMKRNTFTMQHVEGFEAHEGGGMTATVRGEVVYVGNTAFMNLMGIHLPPKLTAKNAIFTAISGVLVGIFTVKYTPVASVQDALSTLLRTRRYPIFAIRDFNMTPLLIRQKFKMPTDGFDFPSFAERYRISSASPEEGSQISAVLTRDGLAPMIAVSDKGKRAHRAVRISVALSLAGAVLGMIVMFFLSWSASYDAAGVGNMMTFMFLWLVPIIVLAFGLNR